MNQFGSFLSFLYERREPFIPSSLDIDLMRVESTDVNRTLQSVQASLSLLYPNRAIPIHTRNVDFDPVLRYGDS